MRYFSMFSGIGGFEKGIEQAYERLSDNQEVGGQGQTKDLSERFSGDIISQPDERRNSTCIGYSEIDKYAIQIYSKHYPEHKNYGSATAIDPATLPDFDLLVGGFPCQAFSIAGKRMGFADTRGTLFFDIARILEAKKPKNFVLENVKGLLSHDNGRTFRTIIGTLAELGYGVEWQVLNSKNFGVPQNRERVFIVGHLGGFSGRQVFPISGTGKETDERLASTAIDCNYWKGFDNHGQRTGIEQDAKIRRLTPTECERLQGFPDGWTEGISDTQRYKCCGNAVTVNVVQAVIERLLYK